MNIYPNIKENIGREPPIKKPVFVALIRDCPKKRAVLAKSPDKSPYIKIYFHRLFCLTSTSLILLENAKNTTENITPKKLLPNANIRGFL
jgi:hypothetical protein